MRRTKIVCTLGPATSTPERIRELVNAGMDVARVNMSHGSHDTHRQAIQDVRTVAEGVRRPVAVLLDLQGPKIRVGRLEEPLALTPGQEVVFAPEADAEGDDVPTTYRALASDLAPGDRVLLDDGLLEIRCLQTEGDRARFEVIRGGLLHSNKGINIPTGNLSASSLTEKDLADLDFALEQGVEFIGLSFVREAGDIQGLRQRVEGRALILAKIEMARAMRSVDDILDATDLAMVARGDLGVELPFEEVPLAQKQIIQKANFHARPVITATQMLESMIENPRPTRAEASDVANAVLDGTDAVMLSAETAVGRYPVEAVRSLVRIIDEIEGSGVLESGPRYLGGVGHALRSGATDREHAVASATVDAARHLKTPAVLVITRSGFSARLVSSHRPPVPIFAVTTEARTHRELAVVWGVTPVLADEVEVSYEALTEFGKEAVRQAGVGREGDSILVTAGVPFHVPGTTNTMRVEHL
ncbi:MAG: pyruvate kinase [Gemmatimonadales bacterium]|nr:MAG: pyruvate kinase [Gemmatimonadales bacterium]